MPGEIRVVVSERPPGEIKADVLVGIHAAGEAQPLQGSLAAFAPWIRGDAESFLGEMPDETRWFDAREAAAPRALLVAADTVLEDEGLGGEWGSRSEQGAQRLHGHDLRGLGSVIERACHQSAARHVVLAGWPEGLSIGDVVEGMVLRAYSPRSASKVQKVHVCVPKGDKKRVGPEIMRRVEIANACNVARDLANRTARDSTPMEMAAQCHSLHERIDVRIFDEAALEEKGMGLHLAVGQGGKPPCTAVLVYDGRTGDSQKTIVFVGKGVTHDTGGYNIKGKGMYRLTYDKSGACAVMGAMAAAASLEIPARLVGVLPFAENVVDGQAYKPGEVIEAYTGMSVFIEDTDAEGRLLLADAMAWAQDEFEPDVLVDIATLTGAAGGALGEAYAPVFSNDDGVAQALMRASHSCDERVWPMPIHELHERELAHYKADLRNTAGPHGASCIAAAFLRRFVRVPWAHIDMAGKEMWEGPRDYLGEGASGFGTRLLVSLADELTTGC